MLISGLKSVKFAQKFRIFLKVLTLEGTLHMNDCSFDSLTTSFSLIWPLMTSFDPVAIARTMLGETNQKPA